MRLSRARKRAVMWGRGVGDVDEDVEAKTFIAKDRVTRTIALRNRSWVGHYFTQPLGSVWKKRNDRSPHGAP
jgi:hypothetical protein